MKTSVERWWNDSGRGKTELLGGKPFQVSLVLHKSQMDDLGLNPGPRDDKPATNA